MQHIITIEGFGGYPFGKSRKPKSIQTLDQIVAGLGPSQVLNFVIPILDAIPETKWYYYPQFMVWPVIWKVRTLLRTKQPSDTINMIGFSYGGAAVHRIAHSFREPVFDKVVSLDPVGKWRLNVTPKNPNDYGFRKPASVGHWTNLFQRIDKCSFAPGRPWLTKAIWGGSVEGADQETELGLDDFQCDHIYNNGVTTHGFPETVRFSDQAHVWFPAQNEALKQIELSFK